jgi:hypothetical protein
MRRSELSETRSYVQAWKDTMLLARLRRQPNISQDLRSEHAQAHIIHTIDCVLHAKQDENAKGIAALQAKENSLLADQDTSEIRLARTIELQTFMRRSRILQVMLQLLLCNGSPTSEFSTKASQFARNQVANLHLMMPPFEWKLTSSVDGTVVPSIPSV